MHRGKRRGRERPAEGHIRHTQRWETDVNKTEQDSGQGPSRTEAALHRAGASAHARIPDGNMGADEPARGQRGGRGNGKGVRTQPGGALPRDLGQAASQQIPSAASAEGGNPQRRAPNPPDWDSHHGGQTGAESGGPNPDEAIYEADFLQCSYGFRPGRNPHMALGALRSQIISGKVRYVFETDIRGYFNHINHQWLMRMLSIRIGDPVILRLVGKWLKAGAMVNGVLVRTEEGTPQGGAISPILANVYLHYVLDLWFERRFKRQCRGEAYLTRFADDFVLCLQYRGDAEQFAESVTERMQQFGLELAAEKTRLLTFGRFARGDMARHGKKPGTFDFLGFKHVCGTDRSGKFALVRIPRVKSCRRFLDRVHTWLASHLHWKRRDQQAHLTRMLLGFYQYFGLHHCEPKLHWVRHEVQLQWIRRLRRQSQRHRLYWTYLQSRSWFELPYPSTIHSTV